MFLLILSISFKLIFQLNSLVISGAIIFSISRGSRIRVFDHQAGRGGIFCNWRLFLSGNIVIVVVIVIITAVVCCSDSGRVFLLFSLF